jgi:hypothetical protein
MDDLFSDLRDDDFEEVESPFEGEGADIGFDDELDQLRTKSARTESAYGDMDEDDAFGDGRSGFALSNFNTSQKIILLALLLLDIVAVGFGLLVLTGRI